MAENLPKGLRTGYGSKLNKQWGIGAAQAYYHKDGKWFNVLKKFPGALCDQRGYILFENREKFESCEQLKIGSRINVPGGIEAISGYVRKQ